LTDQDSRSQVSVNGPNGHVSSLSCIHLKPFKRCYLCVAALIGLLLAVASSVAEMMASSSILHVVVSKILHDDDLIGAARVGRGLMHVSIGLHWPDRDPYSGGVITRPAGRR